MDWRTEFTARTRAKPHMALEVDTKDCIALSDAEISEMADMCAETPVPYEAGLLSKQTEEWVLCCQATDNGQLKGFAFYTLERIGGTPAIIIGLASVRRDSRRDSVLKGLVTDLMHRAVMAFPDEDVLVSARVVDPGGLEVLDKLSDIRPACGVRVNGEERAWGRRLSKRYGASGFDDRTMLAKAEGPVLAVDHVPAGKVKAGSPTDAFDTCDRSSGDFVIAWGWAMAEFLEKYR